MPKPNLNTGSRKPAPPKVFNEFGADLSNEFDNPMQAITGSDPHDDSMFHSDANPGDKFKDDLGNHESVHIPDSSGNYEESDDSNENQDTFEDPDYGNDGLNDFFDTSDRDPANTAAEALRRSRRTEEMIGKVLDRLDSISSNNSSSAGPAPSFEFDPKEREIIGEAMKTDPAKAIEILAGNIYNSVVSGVQNRVTQEMSRNTQLADVRRRVHGRFPMLADEQSPYTRAVKQRVLLMRDNIEKRGISVDSLPEIYEWAATSVASQHPELLGNKNSRVNMGELSRRRRANRASSSTNGERVARKGGGGDLPKLSREEYEAGKTMGLDMDDPATLESVRRRRKHYEERRR